MFALWARQGLSKFDAVVVSCFALAVTLQTLNSLPNSEIYCRCRSFFHLLGPNKSVDYISQKFEFFKKKAAYSY